MACMLLFPDDLFAYVEDPRFRDECVSYGKMSQADLP